LTEGATVSIEELKGTRYSRILTYPSSDDAEAEARISELTGMGTTALCFGGHTLIDGLPVLGKGCVGIVTKARIGGELVALKIRRLDANRPSMQEEARLLRVANAVNVGPRLTTATKNFIAMELFRGIPLFRWAEGSPGRKKLLKHVLSNLISACFRLDSIGLDHGELSHAPKNVLVDGAGEACIVDFESASMVRRVANVTSLLQYFLFGSISKTLHSSMIFPSKKAVVKALSTYKQESSIESYQQLLQALKL